MNQIPFADDTALVADSEAKLRQQVNEFGWIRKRKKLRVNVSKRTVMRCRMGKGGGRMNLEECTLL